MGYRSFRFTAGAGQRPDQQGDLLVACRTLVAGGPTQPARAGTGKHAGPGADSCARCRLRDHSRRGRRQRPAGDPGGCPDRRLVTLRTGTRRDPGISGTHRHLQGAGALAELGSLQPGDTLTVTGDTRAARTFSVLPGRNGTRVRFRSIGSSTVAAPAVGVDHLRWIVQHLDARIRRQHRRHGECPPVDEL